MGFIVITAIGAVLGWLASILTRSDDGRGIMLNVLVGVVGAWIAGSVASEDSLVLGLSVAALLAAVAGSIVLLGGLYVARLRNAR